MFSNDSWIVFKSQGRPNCLQVLISDAPPVSVLAVGFGFQLTVLQTVNLQFILYRHRAEIFIAKGCQLSELASGDQLSRRLEYSTMFIYCFVSFAAVGEVLLQLMDSEMGP